MVVTSKLRRHKVMERAMRALMGNNLPPRFKFKDTYDSIEVPTAYQQHLPSQATLEAKFDELIAEEEVVAPTTEIKADMVVSSNLEVGTSNLFVDTETGNVGIGTDSPAYTLDVHGTSNVGALTATSVSGSGSGLTSLNASNLASGTVPSARLSLAASVIPNLDATKITSGTLTRPISTTTGTFSGDVGIGTDSPAYTLDVHGTSNVGALTATTVTASAFSGNASTATKLATARAINGVNFDGSAAITVNGTSYNVNNAWLKELGDNAHFKQYGNSRQMVFRTDGTTQYASDVGAYPFAWMYGGDAASNRRMLLNTSGQLWCSNYGWLHDKFMARTQVFSDTNANAGFDGQTIDYNASGSQTTTTDRVHRALFIDVDSTATGGDTNHEHRLYGIYNDVRHSGDSDLVYGMYCYTRSDHTSGTTTNLRAGDFLALASGTGTNTNIYGLNSYALKDGGSTGTTANMYGVRGEVEVDAGTCTTAYAFQSHIDRDGGTITTGYLYYGSYSGTVGTKWGLYLTGETKNYFSGSVGIGTASPGYLLEVNGSSMFRNTINLTTSSGYASMELGGPSGAYIDLKNPASDDNDFRILTTGIGGEIQIGGVGTVMTFDGSGNVGIGTNNPVVKLDVRGDIMFSGSLYQLNRGLGGEIVFDRGGYRIHIFKASGIFTSYGVTTADVLLVAGGGGGGNDNAGGGGAGGLIFRPGMTISNGEKAVVIGQGGLGSPTQTVLATDGSNSTFNGLTALGGGNGAIGYAHSTYGVAGTGGSGGGGQGEWSGGYSGANGLQPSQSGDSGTYGYGNRGGNGNSGGGGGGGAGAVGNNYNGSTGGDGGEGKYFATSGGTTYNFLTMYGYCGVGDNNPKAIEGQNWTNRLYFAGGGGGGNGNDNTGRAVGGNGGGGGALGTYIPSSAPDGGPSDPKNGLPNTGGGGAGGTASGSHQWEHGGNGGTGVCIIRYAI
jgi:hypothetical protein